MGSSRITTDKITNPCSFHTIALLAAINVISLASASKVCFLTFESCLQITNNSTTCCYQWPKDTKKIASSFTEVRIHSGVYTLKENWIITEIKNFTITGNHTTFNCTEKQNFSLIITNSSYIHLKNIHFINCGQNVIKSLGNMNDLLTSITSTVLYLHAVHSVNITNLVFEDSCGHAIIGLDIIGHSLLQNINIYQSSQNNCLCMKQIFIGGIIWFYSKLITLIPAKVSFSHCTIHNISNQGSGQMNNYSSSAISFYLHQQQCIFNMTHITITMVTSIHTPLILMSTSSLDTDTTVISISNSNFSINNVSFVLMAKNYDNTSVLLSMTNNKFDGNTVKRKVISLSNTTLWFQGYTSFAKNMANIILSFNKYIVIEEKAVILFTANKPNIFQQSFHRFVVEQWEQGLNHCPFKFKILSVYIIFCNNTGYFREVYVQSFLNNCTTSMKVLHNSRYLTTNTLYKYAFQQCKLNDIITTQVVKFGKEHDIYHCNFPNENLHFSPKSVLFPGQTVTMNFKHLKHTSKILVYTDTETNPFSDIAPRCGLVNPKCDMIYKKCTRLSYTIKSNTTYNGQCLILLGTLTYPAFVLNISINHCPLGFSLDSNGICNCSLSLQSVSRGIICNISNQKFKLPSKYWISSKGQEIVYTTHCKFTYCLNQPGFIKLHNSDDQCISTRTGMGCGECKKGLSTIFGSAKCRRCSNYGLFLILLFALLGIALVLLLFSLDLTVTNGDIFGFVLFVNIISINSCKEILKQYVMISLCNLDLGIELCFYDGMTDYDALWLQFVFPVYILTLVSALAIASRYSTKIERLTRKKVIPVLATLILLSYNKIMIVTFKGLFSYTTFHYLNSQKTTTYWQIDTSVAPFEAKHLLLFTFCSLVFFLVIIPINAMLLFTKKIYRFQLVSKYFKPFLDAYQASFRDECSFWLGMEFLLRAVLYLISYAGEAHSGSIYIIIILFYTAFVCWFHPFKSSLKLFMYLLYVLYLGIIAVLYLHHSIVYVTEFWKITLMVAPETIRIFELSMMLRIEEATFKNISKLYL